MRRGFTLVEVAVALVVLSVGLLGAAGVVTVAARTLGAARELEAQAALILEVADSLSRVGVAGSGVREDLRGRVTWTVDADGPALQVRLGARATGRSSELHVTTLLPPRSSEGP